MGLPSTAFLRASLALWTRREARRKILHTRAQQDVNDARAGDIHPRQDLVNLRDLRSRQLKEARDKIAEREDELAHATAGSVRRPYERVVMNVVNQSSRDGRKPSLIVLHDTEGGNVKGTADLQSVGQWFNNPNSQASSHVCVDAEGISARYVPDTAKAWHVSSYNSTSLGIEQIGFASQSAWPEAQLRKSAQYVAYWSKKYDIPIERSKQLGVCMHSELGAAGGGHTDPGAAYPIERVLDLARDYKTNGW